jgi:hypothetical protein
MTEQKPADLAGKASEIAGRIGLSIPASAKVEYAEAIAGQDDAARLIYSMPETDWRSMRDAPPLGVIDPQTWSGDNVFHLGPDEGEWNPRSVKGLQVAQTMLKGGAETINVGVAPPQGGTVRVFLFWHQL